MASHSKSGADAGRPRREASRKSATSGMAGARAAGAFGGRWAVRAIVCWGLPPKSFACPDGWPARLTTAASAVATKAVDIMRLPERRVFRPRPLVPHTRGGTSGSTRQERTMQKTCVPERDGTPKSVNGPRATGNYCDPARLSSERLDSFACVVMWASLRYGPLTRSLGSGQLSGKRWMVGCLTSSWRRR